MPTSEACEFNVCSLEQQLEAVWKLSHSSASFCHELVLYLTCTCVYTGRHFEPASPLTKTFYTALLVNLHSNFAPREHFNLKNSLLKWI